MKKVTETFFNVDFLQHSEYRKHLNYYKIIYCHLSLSDMEEVESKSQIGRARRFYNATDVPNMFRCINCNEHKNGTYPTNLVSHYKNKHFAIFKEHIARRTEEPIELQRLKLLHSCVELVTINSQPFSLLSSSGYRSSVESKLHEFQLAGCALNLSDHHVHEVKEKVHECRSKIEERIKFETKHEVIALMVDGATRNGRSFFGINIQYRYDGKLRMACLSVQELKNAHTAEYLSDVLMEVLSRYGIKLDQILTFTTDNGSNMLAMVRKLEKRLFATESAAELDDADDETLEPGAEDETEDAIALDSLLNDNLEFDQLFDGVFGHLKSSNSNKTMFLSSIRCAAHTLQLIVWNALDGLEDDERNVIELCREASKFLRLQSSQKKMTDASLKYTLPPLDCKTRWSSTYLMVR